MAIRPEVQELTQLGPFPASQDADEQGINRRGDLLGRIEPPVTDEEATALLACFGPDEAFGLAWALLHLIETAPAGSPVREPPTESTNEWIKRLWDRSHR
jgi:hypothetical protein